MPDLYGIDDFDLAGFAVGIAEKDAVLPRTAEIGNGDVILGLPSSGIHSNGLSLARKVIPESDAAAWDEMLVPTRVYAAEMRALIDTGRVLAAAHITGGGLFGNLQRVIPDGLRPSFTFDWPFRDLSEDPVRGRDLRWGDARGVQPGHRDCDDRPSARRRRPSRVRTRRAAFPSWTSAFSSLRPIHRARLMARLAVFASGTGSNFVALASALKGAHRHVLEFLLCDIPGARVLDRAKELGVSTVLLSYDGLTRQAVEKKMVRHLERRGVDVVALAGFMKLLTPYFLDAFKGPVVNLHPSLLPEVPRRPCDPGKLRLE